MTYLRAPVGLMSCGDVFCYRTDQALVNISGVHKLVDDILVTGRNKKELVGHVACVFKACWTNGITLSKAQVGQTMKFAAFVVDHEGTRPDPVKVEA